MISAMCRSKRYVQPLVFLFVFVTAGISTAIAQLPTATILGVVKDASGAVIPDASVAARNVETGQTRTATTGSEGSYRFSALPVGNYELRVEHPGFQIAIRSGLTLAVAQEAVVNFTLQLGGVEQTVSVTAEAPLVETTSGSLGGLVDERKVSELPLNGRNYIDLTLLQTGVNQHSRHGDTAGATGTWFSSSGAPVRSNSFLLDGASMLTVWGASSASIGNTTLGVEGIREFRVVTNSFSAEYGMTMGSQTVIVSKSGANNYHGSLFEYLRNSALDARNFFDYKTLASNRRLPAFTRNQFGGSIGGPIQHDKMFFHATFEALRERLGITKIANVIPVSNKVDGGLVPQIHPNIRPLLSLFPGPNLPGNQFTFPFTQPTREDYGQTRVDRNISAADSIFGRYTIDDAEKIGGIEYPQWREPRRSRSQFATLSETHIFSPAVLSTFRFSYSRTLVDQKTSSGVSGPQFSFVEGQELSQLAVTGLTSFSGDNASPSLGKQNIFTWSGDLFYTKGNHSFKFGTLINGFQQYMKISLQTRGNITFASQRDFLLGNVQSFTRLTAGGRQERSIGYKSLGFYTQDDWRVKPTLTLNLGMRYEFITIPQESMDPSIGSAVRDLRRDSQATLGRGLLGENPSLKNFGPRLGFAWDVWGDGKTAVRGGFGLLYDLNSQFGTSLLSAAGATPPFSSLSAIFDFRLDQCCPIPVPPEAVGRSVRLLDYHLQQPHILHYNLTAQRELPWSMAVTLAYAGSRGLNLVRHVDGNPTFPAVLPDGRKFWTGREQRVNTAFDYIRLNTASGDSWYNSFQFGLQKRMHRGLQLQSSYTWSRTVDTTQGVVPADSSGDISPVDALDNRTDKAPAAFDILHNWRFNAIYKIPGLPTTGIAGKLLGGWWMSGILSLQSGYPFSATLQRNRSRSKYNDNGSDRPDLAPGVKASDIVKGVSRGCGNLPAGTPIRAPERYFDPCAFTIQPAGFLGNAGRNILRGPGRATLDFSLAKDTNLGFLGEGGKLEFRAEIFNILNHANFLTPSSSSASPSAVFVGAADVENPIANVGRITATATASRQIQLALRIVF